MIRKWNCSVDRSAHYLIPVPGGADGPSGVLVCSEGWIGWYHVDSTPVRIPIPTRVDGCDPLDENERRLPIILSHAVHKMKKVLIHFQQKLTFLAIFYPSSNRFG